MDTSEDPTHGLVRASRPARLLEAEQSFSLTRYLLSPVCVCVLLFDPWHLECWGGRQGGRGPE